MMRPLRFQNAWREVVAGMRENLLHSRLTTGVFVAMSDQHLLDLYAKAGFDFIIIDFEHAPITLSQADSLIESAIHVGMAPLVRAAASDRQALLRTLDAGAAGIVVPDVRSVAEVREWAECISYPPSGTRGVSQVRANDWDISGITDTQEHRPLLVPMIESLEAISIAEDLFALEEADWYHIGLADLGMRLRDQADAPAIADLTRDLARKARAAGKGLGYNQGASPVASPPPEGICCVAVPDRALILNGSRLFCEGTL